MIRDWPIAVFLVVMLFFAAAGVWRVIEVGLL